MEFTYKGLKAQLNKHIVTDEEVDKQIERVRSQNPRIAVIKDRPTENGDEVVLDYAGYCDGVQFEGGTAENQTLVLGSGMFIPGFEEQLLDKVCEEPVTVKVTFPAEYHAPNLAGKDAEFRCTIHEIRVKTQYELDDVFAQEVGGCYTFDELREQVKKGMQENIDQRGEMDLQDRLLRQAAATLDYTVDPEELEKAVAEQLQNMEAQLARQGLSLQMYCSFMNTTEEDLHKDAYPAAEAALRNLAAVDKIVELEKLEATQEELGQAIAVICRNNGVTVEHLKEVYDEEFEKAVMRSVLTGKVMAFIRDAADVTVTK
ncbi:MAG: trigger factor [Ruminococcaceae bacterium]|nr:trigger factor [Oscillospiraceae bacterium]